MLSWALFLGSLALHLFLVVRLIARRGPIPVTLAWLVVIVFVPYAGVLLYLLFGEGQLGRARGEQIRRAMEPIWPQLEDRGRRYPVSWADADAAGRSIHRLALAWEGVPALGENRLSLVSGSQGFFDSLVADIDGASHSVSLLFYIWSEGGNADRVADALVRAVKRGVKCRLLLDHVGSRPFFKSQSHANLVHAGVEIRPALPVGLVRMWFQRADMRNHRKIVVIDGKIAYTGSHNLCDPAFFKKDAGVGQWVDAMVRLEGPTVPILELVFSVDWSNGSAPELRETEKAHPQGVPIQVMPSQPGRATEAAHDVLVAMLYAAASEIRLTTPYFVPTEALLTALASAALRGVEVTLILPEKNDSFLVQQAADASLEALIAAGVRIARFGGGLLHVKSVTVDGKVSLFGSMNLDRRSLFLNREVSLIVYDPAFTRALRELQGSFLLASSWLDGKLWAKRSSRKQWLEACVRLVSPLL